MWSFGEKFWTLQHVYSVSSYVRRLPHFDVPGTPVFVTFRLHGSLPRNRVFPAAEVETAGRAFVAMDRLLDGATAGPRWLVLPEIAQLVVDGMGIVEGELHAYAVMPNHVHMLVTAHVALRRWLRQLKGSTAYTANQLLGLRGRPFWQDESYDRVVRSDLEFRRIRKYIEANPVAAGIVGMAEYYRWSSARRSDG